MIELASVAPLEELAQQDVFADPLPTRDLERWARTALSEGVRHRTQKQFSQAYLYYRFALYATYRLQSIDGFDAATGSTLALRVWLREALLRGNIDADDLTEQPTDEWRSAFKISGDDTLARMKTDAVFLWARVREVAAPAGQDPSAALKWSNSIRRIAILTGDIVARRAALEALCGLARENGADADALMAVLEELEQSTESEVSVPIEPSAVDRTFQITHKGLREERLQFEAVWARYEAHRPALADATPQLVGALGTAFRHFEHLRFIITANGGPMSHIFSFEVSRKLQTLGRDLLLAQLKTGDAQGALATAERVKARAFGDLMSRSHFVPFNRAAHQFRNTLIRHPGNVQSIEPVTPRDMGRVVYGTDAAMLFYIQTSDGLAAWLILPDGSLTCWLVPDAGPSVSSLLARLPYFDNAADAVRGRRRDVSDSDVEEELADVDEELSAVWQSLIPEEIEARVQGCSRLLVVPDAELEYVPFCALRMRDGRYVTQKFELIYWPSVTAGLATESDYSAREALVTTDSIPYYRGGNLTITNRTAFLGQNEQKSAVYADAGLVIGNPELDEGYELPGQGGARSTDLSGLVGAEEEAMAIGRRLEARVLTGREATNAAMNLHGRDVRVLHIAAHAVADAADPQNSFVALADGPLTAGALYQTGFGFGGLAFHAGLVVLSGCQTGLGILHPDSVISLANGFLIAGANSVLSTLWSIRDEASMQLMISFIGKMQDGQTLPAALRAAQLERLDDPLTTHPEYWAAFKLTGNARNPLSDAPVP